MKPHAYRGATFTFRPLLHFNTTTTTHSPPVRRRRGSPAEISLNTRNRSCNCVFRQKHCHASVTVRCRQIQEEDGEYSAAKGTKRRDVLIAPLLAIGACILRSAVVRADEKPPEVTSPASTATEEQVKVPVVEKEEEVINSRIYDATVIGEPWAVGKDKRKVWEKVMNARIVYLGEAEQVPTRDDKELELEIVKNLRKKCAEADRPIYLALEAFPADLQDQLNQYMDQKID